MAQPKTEPVKPDLVVLDAEAPPQVPAPVPPAPSASSPAVKVASIFAAPSAVLSGELTAAAEGLEAALGMPVWLLIQRLHMHHPLASLSDEVPDAFYLARKELQANGPVALVIDSPGGSAAAAYRLARLLQNHAGGFAAVIPRYAKSAATLLAFGAQRVYMSADAELGPLDAQIFEDDREDYTSALNEVQALERLNVTALEQFDAAMMMLLNRTGKKVETCIPHATRFASDLMRPLLERIDTVHYTQQSRALKVAEDYAVRLLGQRYSPSEAERIAGQFVNGYPEHGFVISRDEAREHGFRIEDSTQEQTEAIEAFAQVLTVERPLVMGRLREEEATP